MTERPWGRLAAFAAGVLVLALILPHGFALAQRTLSKPMVLPDSPVIAVYLRLVLGTLIVLMALATVVISLSGPREHILARSRKRLPPIAQLAIVAGAIFIAWGLAQEGTRIREALSGFGGGHGKGGHAGHRLHFTVSHSFGIAVTIMLAVAVVALLVGMWLLARRGRVLEWEGEALDEELIEAVAEGLETLDVEGEPREAIIACYVRMQEALVTAGVARRVSDTPFELVERVLVQRSEAAPGARRLTVLFERARFSHHPVTEEMRDQAAQALRQIGNGLRARSRPAAAP